jgi:hypothetical protein
MGFSGLDWPVAEPPQLYDTPSFVSFEERHVHHLRGSASTCITTCVGQIVWLLRGQSQWLNSNFVHTEALPQEGTAVSNHEEGSCCIVPNCSLSIYHSKNHRIMAPVARDFENSEHPCRDHALPP